jgi:hypothetical protein
MQAHILCRHRDTNLPHTDHTYHFRKWLGRDLSKREYEVINALERRRRKGVIKVHIVDKPGQNSRAILIKYIQFLGTIYPRRVATVYDSTKMSATRICRSLPIKAYPASVRRPNTETVHARISPVKTPFFPVRDISMCIYYIFT